MIDIFDINLKKPLTNLLSFNTSETLKQSLKILILYSSLTLVIFIILNIFDIRSFNSFNLSMTIISSGGFLPTNNLEIIINSKVKEIVLSFLMLISFFSLLLSYNLFTIKNKNLSFFQEDLYLLVYFCIIVLLFFFLLKKRKKNTEFQFMKKLLLFF